MKDIVVTGMGVLSTAGHTVEEFWNTLINGKITYKELDELADDTNYRIKVGAKIRTKHWSENLPQNITKKYGQAACYTVSTVLRAIDDGNIDLNQFEKERIAVIIGTTMGEIGVEEEIVRQSCHSEIPAESMYKKYPTCNIVNAVAEFINAKGYIYTVPAACAAGNYAVDLAKKLLAWDYADIVIAGGVDVFSYVAFAGFQRLLSLTPDLCRPFDKNRKGLVVGEGCGIVIMEREHERNNQKQYGKILGTGLASNAYHMTAPHIEGIGELAVMKKAIESAGLSYQDIDYISAHGTGTKLNDITEAKAINKLFDNAPYVSSIKSMLGHSMGAASILELVASFLMLKNKIILPNINLVTQDDECTLNIVCKPMKRELKYILSNSFAFGGQTSSVAIGVS